MARMCYIPTVVQRVLRCCADHRSPKIQRGCGEPPTSMGPEPAMDFVPRAVWGILHVNEACIVSRSPRGLA